MTVTVRHDFLPTALVDEVASLYESALDWEREDQEAQYGPSHQSFSGFGMPADGDPYRALFDKSIALQESGPVREAVRLVGGTTHRCYRMGPGQWFRIHVDDYFGGRFSHSLYLNRSWAWDWGGLLHVLEGRQCQIVFPAFNALMSMDHSMPHFVSPVAWWAMQSRYVLAVFGGITL